MNPHSVEGRKEYYMPDLKYPLPSYLVGQTSQSDYNRWIEGKSETIFESDLLYKRPCALAAPPEIYRQKMHNAVVKRGDRDPYTGDLLRWNQIHTWDNIKDKGHINYLKEFSLLPTVDHIDPYALDLEFEICSWLSNGCKSDQTPEEFIAMCKLILQHRGQRQSTPLGSAKIYFLPLFLVGICTEEVYIRWLLKRARQLHDRDLAQGRPYGLAGSGASYKAEIHAAVIATGLSDPYTGETMDYKLIGTWDTSVDQPEGYSKQFRLLPSVDHVDPWGTELHMEICSLRINRCKGSLTPDEFINVCRRVVEYRH
jgi:hypothetical protein